MAKIRHLTLRCERLTCEDTLRVAKIRHLSRPAAAQMRHSMKTRVLLTSENTTRVAQMRHLESAPPSAV